MKPAMPDPSNAPSPCPVCGTPTDIRGSHRSPHNSIHYRLHHCPSCSLEHWSPRDVDLSIYQDEGFEAYQAYHSGSRPFPRWADPLFAPLPIGISSALDIGCGDGAVLQRLQAAGIAVCGIDLDEQSIRIANERCGNERCRVSTLEAFVLECSGRGDTFDLVTFFEVLEHQTDPSQFLEEVGTLVRPGGWVAGSVPNRERFLAKIDRRFGDGDHPPHHFLWFSGRTLHEVLARSGFGDIEITKVESVTYRELNTKLKAAVRRKMSGADSTMLSLMLGVVLAVSPMVAAFVHLGRQLMPSHLYFRCRRPLRDAVRPMAAA